MAHTAGKVEREMGLKKLEIISRGDAETRRGFDFCILTRRSRPTPNARNKTRGAGGATGTGGAKLEKIEKIDPVESRSPPFPSLPPLPSSNGIIFFAPFPVFSLFSFRLRCAPFLWYLVLLSCGESKELLPVAGFPKFGPCVSLAFLGVPSPHAAARNFFQPPPTGRESKPAT